MSGASCEVLQTMSHAGHLNQHVTLLASMKALLETGDKSWEATIQELA